MTVEHVEVLVEEPSAAAALQQLLPRLLGATTFAIHAHQGKDDLLGKLPGKLRAYARWIPQTWRILVLVDRDNERCDELKDRLESVAKTVPLTTRTSAKRRPWVVANRIAIEELEAWYFGDWAAVRGAFPKAAASIPSQAKFRHPDRISGGTWEAFERVMQKAGYFVGGLRKIEAARAIGERMDPARNTSPSFCALREVLVELGSTGSSP